MLKVDNEAYSNAILTWQSLTLLLYSIGILINIIVLWYNIDIIWNDQLNVISMTLASSSLNVQHFEGMTHELSCLHTLCDYVDGYLCIVMYYTIVIHFNIIYHCLYSSQRWSTYFRFETCGILTHTMSVSCNRWLIIDYIMILFNKSIKFEFNLWTHSVDIDIVVHC